MGGLTKCGIDSYKWVTVSHIREWSADKQYNRDEPWNIMPSEKSHAQQATNYMNSLKMSTQGKPREKTD